MTHRVPTGRILNTEIISNQAQDAITKTELEYKYDPAKHEYHTQQEITEIMYSKKVAEEGGYVDEKLNSFVAETATKMLSDVQSENVADENDSTSRIFITKKL